MILDKFTDTINRYNLINKGEGVVVGVSGGPDSLCLLHLLWRIKREYDLRIYVVHLNHQFRGEDADKDAQYVKEFCDGLGIKSYIYSIDIDSYAKDNGITFEEAGRKWRYKLFDDVAKKTNSSKIAVAQNLNDQAETVLMRLMRGSGVEGLAAIDYIRDGRIIRPILDISRNDIENYCKEFDLKPRLDKTNLETIYTRNKIRLELIPYIEKNFNPNIIETLSRSSNIFREDSDFLNKRAQEVFEKISKIDRYNISIDINEFNKEHIALKRRIIRLAIEKIRGNLKDIGMVHIENIIKLCQGGKVGSKIDIIGDIIIKLGYNTIDFQDKKSENKRKVEDFQYPIQLNEKNYIEDIDGLIEVSIISKEDIDYNNKDKCTIYIDKNKVKGNLYIRNRRNGDKFSPIGMKGNKKLKDFFIDLKVPRELRNKIPILCDDYNIIWIVGYRMSGLYKIDNNTEEVYQITFQGGCMEK